MLVRALRGRTGAGARLDRPAARRTL